MPAVMTYALPALQLVCHLVSTGNSNISDMTPAEILGALPTPARALPPGYVAYPDFGVAYKVANELVSWDVAKERCAREGAYLAPMDTTAKIQVVRNQHPSRNLTHVGYYMKNGDTSNWYNVYTGLNSSSIPWESGEPSGDANIYRCAMIKTIQIGLINYECSKAGDYVCQIPYP